MRDREREIERERETKQEDPDVWRNAACRHQIRLTDEKVK
jgi:hypothetical protein